jgi:type IV pilus assembly protein PilY1
MKKTAFSPKKAILPFAAAFACAWSGMAGSFDIHQGPMFADKSVDPNVMFLLDDSSSMTRTYMPDEAPIGGNLRESAFLNKQYYNPEITYQPPFRHDGTRLARMKNSSGPGGACTWPRVLSNGLTNQSTCIALTASTAVYYDYVPGFNTLRDRRDDPTFHGNPLFNVPTASVAATGPRPEDDEFNYEYWAFRTTQAGRYFRKNTVSYDRAGADQRSATTNQLFVKSRACPTLFKDVVESRAYYRSLNHPVLMSNGEGIPHAQCRYSYRVWGVDQSGNMQSYVSSTYYASSTTGALATPGPLNLPNARPWCERSSNSGGWTGVGSSGKVTNLIPAAVSCVMGKHIIGDTNGDGNWTNDSDSANVSDVGNMTGWTIDSTEQSLPHLVTSHVDADGELVTHEARRRSRAEEIRNFSNWYSYYRTRAMAAQSGTSLAFAQLVNPDDPSQPGAILKGKGVRLGYDTINKITDNGPSKTGKGTVPFKDFSAGNTHYPKEKFVQRFYDWVLGMNFPSATPLRQALARAGKYYENEEAWREFPHATTGGSGNVQACRRSFTILMTDGYWNGASGSVGDADKDNGLLIEDRDSDGKVLRSYHYQALPGKSPSGPPGPFFGENPGYPASETLADVAMYYWKRDLLPEEPNKLAPTRKDPAFWQHMQTYTIGLGVIGRLSDTEVNNFLATPDPNINILWTYPTGLDTEYEKIDDLMHAGLNGHAGTAAAEDAGEFAGKLSALLNEIAGEASSNTAYGGGNSTKLQADSMKYLASFNPINWSGDLEARKQCQRGDSSCVAGSLLNDPEWNAAKLLANKPHTTRRIYTWAGSAGVPFNTSLPSTAKSVIDTTVGTPVAGDPCPISRAGGSSCTLKNGTTYTVDHLINYLRGDGSLENTSIAAAVYPNGFRNRGTGHERNILGDIMYSDPVSTDAFDYGYGRDEATALASGQRAAYVTRMANFRNEDGTINTANRKEVLLVGANDGMLHGFDARSGTELFAFIPQGVHATLKLLANPDYEHQFYVDGSTVVSDVLLSGSWKTVAVGSTGRGGRSFFALDVENPASFGAENVLWEFSDPELGVPAHGKAGIALLPNGKWSAVFGNGYNSASDEARLFIVDIDTGSASSIPTGAGSATEKNGLATPFLLDADEDGDADIAYAGDALGNLWKFNLQTNRVEKLLEARDAKGNIQPITAPPAVIASPKHDGTFQVVIGTGKYFERSDVSDTQVQTVYSVRDCGILSACTVGVAASRTNGSLVTREFDGDHPIKDTFINKKSDYSEEKAAFKIKMNDADKDGVDDGVDYTGGQKGFYIDLSTPTGTIPPGARVIYQPDMLRKNLLVQITGPADDPCTSSVTGGLLEINPFTGAPVKSELFKTGHGSMGMWGEGGLGDITVGDFVYIPGGPTLDILSGGRLPGGRQSWRQIR